MRLQVRSSASPTRPAIPLGQRHLGVGHGGRYRAGCGPSDQESSHDLFAYARCARCVPATRRRRGTSMMATQTADAPTRVTGDRSRGASLVLLGGLCGLAWAAGQRADSWRRSSRRTRASAGRERSATSCSRPVDRAAPGLGRASSPRGWPAPLALACPLTPAVRGDFVQRGPAGGARDLRGRRRRGSDRPYLSTPWQAGTPSPGVAPAGADSPAAHWP
jgi:hypothetical protein